MADVSIAYKDSVIAEVNSGGTKTLKTSGCYCEDDIKVSYTPQIRSYEITIPKTSGWLLLVTLDDEVLSHINDDRLVVSLTNVSPWAFEAYVNSMAIASNTPYGYNGNYPAYGLTCLSPSATSTGPKFIYYAPKNTGTETGIGGDGIFRVNGNKYYFRPGSYFLRAGTYKLTFTW